MELRTERGLVFSGWGCVCVYSSDDACEDVDTAWCTAQLAAADVKLEPREIGTENRSVPVVRY